MARDDVTTNLLQQKVWDGHKYRTVKEDIGGKLYYVDDNGKKVEVDSNDLFGMNQNITQYKSTLTEHPQHLVDYYQDLVDKKREEFSFLQDYAEVLVKNLKTANSELQGKLAEIGVTDYKDITDKFKKAKVKKYHDNVVDANKQKRHNNIQQYSVLSFMRMFSESLGDWKIQLGMAQFVERSLGLNSNK